MYIYLANLRNFVYVLLYCMFMLVAHSVRLPRLNDSSVKSTNGCCKIEE